MKILTHALACTALLLTPFMASAEEPVAGIPIPQFRPDRPPPVPTVEAPGHSAEDIAQFQGLAKAMAVAQAEKDAREASPYQPTDVNPLDTLCARFIRPMINASIGKKSYNIPVAPISDTNLGNLVVGLSINVGEPDFAAVRNGKLKAWVVYSFAATPDVVAKAKRGIPFATLAGFTSRFMYETDPSNCLSSAELAIDIGTLPQNVTLNLVAEEMEYLNKRPINTIDRANLAFMEFDEAMQILDTSLRKKLGLQALPAPGKQAGVTGN